MTIVSNAGENKGLTVMLDAHTDWLSKGSVYEDFDGFVAYVGPTNSFPLTKMRGVKIKPGHENNVVLRAQSIWTSMDTKSIEPERRGCIFEEEKDMKIHACYTQVNILFQMLKLP